MPVVLQAVVFNVQGTRLLQPHVSVAVDMYCMCNIIFAVLQPCMATILRISINNIELRLFP